MRITESEIKEIIKECVARILNESFSSKILEGLAMEHKGIYSTSHRSPIHMYSDQQILNGILFNVATGQFLDYDGQDWADPSKKIKQIKDTDWDNCDYIAFTDGSLLIIPPTPGAMPTKSQMDYSAAIRYSGRGKKNLKMSNQYHPIGQNRPVGKPYSVWNAQQDKRGEPRW